MTPPVAIPMTRPRTISHQADEPVDPQGVLEIPSVEIVFTVPEG
jgi:hypothetical protein